MPRRRDYSNRCGASLPGGLYTCQIPVAEKGVRCRHHGRSPEGRAHDRAVRRAAFLLEEQRIATRDAERSFARLAFEHGLDDPRVRSALEHWRTAKTKEGTREIPEHLRAELGGREVL